MRFVHCSLLSISLFEQGDYLAMVVDPSDDCTFWYCTQYQDKTGKRGWKTKIASFNFGGGCASPESREDAKKEKLQ
jgi:hypothetical protein